MASAPEGRQRRSVILHMVSSLDGFIAKPDNSISWLERTGRVYEAGVTLSAAEIAAYLETIDCYVMGARTYEHALELGWPYGETPTIVVSGRTWPAAKASVEFYSGDLTALVESRLAPRFHNIWLVGGAQLCQRFLELGLVDEIKLTMAPVLLGDGLRLFGGAATEEMWELKNVAAYKNGYVELDYVRSSPEKSDEETKGMGHSR
jgi:dihydrofolate reductase